jgi:RNA polymerase sigma-70 factor, ECF subfamily
MLPTTPDIIQILRAQTGDLKAYDWVLQSVQHPLYRYLVRLTGDSALAKDILQEVFVLIFRKLPSLNNPALFRAWVFRLTTRAAFRYLKKEKQEHNKPSDWQYLENLPEIIEDTEMVNHYREVLPDLLTQVSVGSRVVLILHFLEGLKLQEVADALDIPLGTVKSRLAYGLERLRRLMAYK